jgi:hypothetical protein
LKRYEISTKYSSEISALYSEVESTQQKLNELIGKVLGDKIPGNNPDNFKTGLDALGVDRCHMMVHQTSQYCCLFVHCYHCSLSTVRLLSLVKDTFQKEISLKTLFSASSVAELAQHINNDSGDSSGMLRVLGKSLAHILL